MEEKSLLITDLDNTLFNWFDIWYYSFSALLEKTAEISGIPKNQLIEEIKPIHQKHGTSEYTFVLEEIPSIQKMYGNRDAITTNLNEAIHAYRSARKKHLNLYDGVMDTLKTIKKSGAKVIGYTESVEWQSKFRIKRLELDGLIDVLYSPEDHHIPIPHKERTRIDLHSTKCRNTPRHELKPNPELLVDIIESEKEKTKNSVYIGDSILKDIEMAIRAGVDDIHAEYGNSHFEEGDERYELLRSVTHWTDEDVKREKDIIEKSLGFKPNRKASSYSDLLKHFKFKEKT